MTLELQPIVFRDACAFVGGQLVVSPPHCLALCLACAWQCEIDKQAGEVLAHHWPSVKNIGDVRNVGRNTVEHVDLSAEDSPARMYHLQENARALLVSGQDYGSSLRELLTNLSRDGLLLKTSPAFYPAAEDGILRSSFDGWQSAGMAFAGGCLTLSISELPNAAAVCSLSQVLETDAPQKYYLSAKACAGILRRVTAAGKALPLTLETVLKRMVQP